MISRRAFSLIELLVVVAVIALLVAILLPALASARRVARMTLCTANLQQLGRAHSNYANDFREIIGALTGSDQDTQFRNVHTHPFGTAAGRQAQLIVNATGIRPTPIGAFVGDTGSNVSIAEQWEHLVLIDYMRQGLYMSGVICPEDRARQEWQRFPYVPTSWGFQPRKLNNKANIEWWPYSSSYQLTPASAVYTARMVSGVVYSYAQRTFHDAYYYSKMPFGSRKTSEILFPSAKIAIMDSQQRHFDKDLFYAYPDSRQPLLSWDGAVAIRKTGDSNQGWTPPTGRPTDIETTSTMMQYVPDPGFESVSRGTKQLFGYYRWTRNGLHGIDFGGSEPKSSLAGEMGPPGTWY